MLSDEDEEEKRPSVRLNLRDYIALFFAALETVGLPLLVFIFVVALVIVLSKVLK